MPLERPTHSRQEADFAAVPSGKEDWQVPKDIMDMCDSVELTPSGTGQQHRNAHDGHGLGSITMQFMS